MLLDLGATVEACCFSVESFSPAESATCLTTPGLAPSAAGTGSIAPAFSRLAVNRSLKLSQRSQWEMCVRAFAASSGVEMSQMNRVTSGSRRDVAGVD